MMQVINYVSYISWSKICRFCKAPDCKTSHAVEEDDEDVVECGCLGESRYVEGQGVLGFLVS